VVVVVVDELLELFASTVTDFGLEYTFPPGPSTIT